MAGEEKLNRPAGAWPWATLALAGVAAAVSAWPGADAALVFDRGAIAGGQVWRLWTGHAVHLSASHLLWNLAVFVPVGGWVERVAPRPTRWLLALAPLVIAGALLVFAPALERYAGLSGLATGLVVLLALDRLWASAREPRWIWLGVLGLVAGKILAESLTGGALFARFAPESRPVPLAHVAGVACALAVFFGAHRTIWLRSRPGRPIS